MTEQGVPPRVKAAGSPVCLPARRSGEADRPQPATKSLMNAAIATNTLTPAMDIIAQS